MNLIVSAFLSSFHMLSADEAERNNAPERKEDGVALDESK